MRDDNLSKEPVSLSTGSDSAGLWHVAKTLTRTATQMIMGKHIIILITKLKTEGKWLQPAHLISLFSIYALSTENASFPSQSWLQVHWGQMWDVTLCFVCFFNLLIMTLITRNLTIFHFFWCPVTTVKPTSS